MTLRLTPDTSIEPWPGGTVIYRATLDGRWVGWVGDGRIWRGWRYSGRLWFACWRQDGDPAARWCSELAYRTRTAAITALLDRIDQPPGR
jgi:hypothetical protein